MLRTLWFFSTFIGICFSAATASFVLFLIKRVGLPAPLFGVFMLSGAVGGIVGSVLVARAKDRFGGGPVMAFANLMSALALVFIGLVPQLWAALVGFFITSLTVTAWNILVMSLRQSIIPGTPAGAGARHLAHPALGCHADRSRHRRSCWAGSTWWCRSWWAEAPRTLAGLVFYRFLTRLPNPEDVDNGDPHPEAGPTDPLVTREG